MQPPLPCPVETWHNDTYEAISPTRPELSAAGKTVIIVGGGSGIGRETSLAFTTAGASRVVLIGRTSAKLEETAAKVEVLGGCSSSVHVADVTKEDELRAAASEIGEWDIFILCSGWCPTPAPVTAVKLEDWWAGFNVRTCSSCCQLVFDDSRNRNLDQCQGDISCRQSILQHGSSSCYILGYHQ
ncbi:hypothetical protein GGR57DRAFT_74840 [Xylariaceae sp. FL1272]|nr:hypothetical protein GGR57DRAFT_74840 [Xylariaceae sp. FL1272]